MAKDKVISTLNDLIRTNRNAEEGFREAAENVEDTELSGLFAGYSQQRARFATELQTEVQRLGGDVETEGSAAGAAHRTWMDLRSAVQGGNRKAILSEAERGEDVAKEKYEGARKEELPPELKEVVERQYHDVREAHDRIRSLRDASR